MASTAAFSLDSLPDAILVIDSNGHVVSANQQAEVLFGCPRDELLDQPIADLLPEGSDEARASARSAQVRKRGCCAASIHCNGSRFPVALTWKAAPENGNGYVVLSLREADGGAPRRSPRIGSREQIDIFSLFNHDVRQSLQSIQFVCDSLAESSPGTASSISEIIGSVKNLLDMILRLDDVGTMRAEDEQCVLDDLLQALGRELEPVALRKGLRLEIEPVREEIRTDPVLLHELLQNLVANAIHYTEEGAVTVRCRSTPASVRIDVTDTGIGIAVEQIESLFTKSRASIGASRSAGGSGLGLAIAQRLADVLGCRIDVESSPGDGSTFSVTLPRRGSRHDPIRVLPRDSSMRSESEGH